MAPSMKDGMLLAILLIWSLVTADKDEFNEELLIKPLKTGHVYSHFHFVTKWAENLRSDAKYTHYDLFPRALGEIVKRHGLLELHLTLSQGRWRHQTWGSPVVDAPPGAELWVHRRQMFANENSDDAWSELTHSLAGLFCASLNFLDASTAVNPKLSLRHSTADNDSTVRYALLPRENVCTENLTPWKKLLPCGSQAGIATLLNAGQIFNSNYHSLGVHLVPSKKSQPGLFLELVVTVSVVAEPVAPKQGWSFKKLYSGLLHSACYMASSSQVFVDISDQKGYWNLSPEPDKLISKEGNKEVRNFAVYNVLNSTAGNKFLNVATTVESMPSLTNVIPPAVWAHRYITGFGHESGGIQCQIHNTQSKEPVVVVYMEVIPWFLRVYLHTLRISSGQGDIAPRKLHFVPAVDRKKPTLLEVELVLPPNSVTKIYLEFERTLLMWTEYPPDANHGFYVGAATIYPSPIGNFSIDRDSQLLSSSRFCQSPYASRVTTEALLVSLPTPDFSMPYNVICLTCTIVALAFGPMHNLTVKRLQAVYTVPESFFEKIKKKCSCLLGKGKKEKTN